MIIQYSTPLVESSMTRIMTHMGSNRNVGIISASRAVGSPNADGTVRTGAQNAKLTKQLSGELQKRGLSFAKISGRTIENIGTPTEAPVSEHSFMVIGNHGDDNGMLHNHLTKLATMFGQDSVIMKPHHTTKAHLVGTSPSQSAWPSLGTTADLGEFHPGINYSQKLPNGSPDRTSTPADQYFSGVKRTSPKRGAEASKPWSLGEQTNNQTIIIEEVTSALLGTSWMTGYCEYVKKLNDAKHIT